MPVQHGAEPALGFSPVAAREAGFRQTQRQVGHEILGRQVAFESVALSPNVALSEGAELLDLAGDGLPDVVVIDGPTPGLYEHDDGEGWLPLD